MVTLIYVKIKSVIATTILMSHATCMLRNSSPVVYMI